MNILYFGNDWNADNHTSSHHIAAQLSKYNRVFYIEASGLRAPRMSGHDIARMFRKVSKAFCGPRKVSDSIYVYSPLLLPFHGNALIERVNKYALSLSIKRAMKKLGFKDPVLWITIPHMAMVVDRLDKKGLVYYCVDDYPSFPGVTSDAVLEYDAYLTKNADIVFTPSKPIYEKKSKINKNTFLSPHGVDISHFAMNRDRDVQVPADIKNLKHPIIGFFGLIEKWVDLALIQHVAIKRPDWSILMIGRVAQDISGLAGLKNITFLGAKSYSIIPDYGRSFDVAILPYKLNDWIYNANPIKLREYLCMGKPVVSVRTPEMETFSDVIEIADGYDDFIEKIDKCLASDSEQKRNERMKRVENLSWENRYVEISTIVSSILKERLLLNSGDTSLNSHIECSSQELSDVSPEFSSQELSDVSPELSDVSPEFSPEFPSSLRGPKGAEAISFRVGIIGCGNIAEKHIESIRKYIDISNIALCDRDTIRLDDFAKRHGIVKTYTDISDMYKDFHPDIAHILTPPKTHKDIAIQCLEKGMNVLIEKPMCVSVGEADEIIQACARTGKKVCIDHMRSFDEQVRRIRDLLSGGSFGEIAHINASYSHDILTNTKFVGNRWAQGLPGGMLFDIAPHVICLLQDFIPELQERATSIERNNDGIVTGIATLFHGKNATASMHISLRTEPLQNFVELFCAKGIIKIDLRNFITILNPKGKLPGPIARITGPISMGWQYIAASIRNVFKFLFGKLNPYNGLDFIISAFYTALLQNKDIPVGAEKGKALAVILDKIFSQIPDPKKDCGACCEPVFEIASADFVSLAMTGEAIAQQEKFRLLAMTNDSSSKSEPLHSDTHSLKPADILVTGGTGIIGSNLVKRLTQKGCSVRILAHSSIVESETIKSNNNISIVKGDIYNYKDVEDACRGVKTVYHLAAAMKGDWNYHLDTTVSGARNIFEACLKTGVRHLIYTSTLNVLDAKKYPNGKTIDESFPYEDMPEKRGAYSHAKLKAEKLLLGLIEKNKGKVTVTILRPGLVYGSKNDTLPRDVAIRLGKRLGIVMGLGSRRLPLIYIDNLIDALVLAMTNPKNGIYNIVDGEYPTQRLYMKCFNKYQANKVMPIYLPFCIFLAGFWIIEKAISLLLNKKVSLIYKLKCISKSPRHSTAKIENDLGWKQNVSFLDGLKK